MEQTDIQIDVCYSCSVRSDNFHQYGGSILPWGRWTINNKTVAFCPLCWRDMVKNERKITVDLGVSDGI